MKAAIDELLIRHHGTKDLLKRVDADYAAMVQRACTDPNSLLHPTTCQHISRYVKHLAKLKNTSSSLNTSSEKVLETQQLWQNLTTDSPTFMRLKGTDGLQRRGNDKLITHPPPP